MAEFYAACRAHELKCKNNIRLNSTVYRAAVQFGCVRPTVYRTPAYLADIIFDLIKKIGQSNQTSDVAGPMLLLSARSSMWYAYSSVPLADQCSLDSPVPDFLVVPTSMSSRKIWIPLAQEVSPYPDNSANITRALNGLPQPINTMLCFRTC